MTPMVSNSPKDYLIYLADDYYNSVVDESLYFKLNKLENKIRSTKHTNLPIDIYRIMAYLTIECTLQESKKGLGGSVIFLPCGFEEKCVNALFNNSSYLEKETTLLCFELDRKLLDVSHVLALLRTGGVEPIYLIAPILSGGNVDSLMITDFKEKFIWTFEPGNSNAGQQDFEKHLKSENPLTVELMKASSSLYANYFYANNLINCKSKPTKSKTEMFHFSHGYKSNRFKIAHYLSKDDSLSSHFSLLLIIQLFIQEMVGSTGMVRDGVNIVRRINDTIKASHNEYMLTDLTTLLLETYKSFSTQTKKTVSKHTQVRFYSDVWEQQTSCSKKRKGYQLSTKTD